MERQAGWRAWSGGWRTGEPPADWWLSTDGRWYPPGVRRPPEGPRWRGSAAEFRPRELAVASTTRSPQGGLAVVTRAAVAPSPPRHKAQRATGPSAFASLLGTTAIVLIAAVAALVAALVFA